LFLVQSIQTGTRAHKHPIQWVSVVIFHWEKLLGRKAEHSPPCNAEVKEWSHTSTPSTSLHSVHNGNFTFTSHIPSSRFSFLTLNIPSSHCSASCLKYGNTLCNTHNAVLRKTLHSLPFTSISILKATGKHTFKYVVQNTQL
jgi:hypothetical protein